MVRCSFFCIGIICILQCPSRENDGGGYDGGRGRGAYGGELEAAVCHVADHCHSFKSEGRGRGFHPYGRGGGGGGFDGGMAGGHAGDLGGVIVQMDFDLAPVSFILCAQISPGFGFPGMMFGAGQQGAGGGNMFFPGFLQQQQFFAAMAASQQQAPQ